MGVDHGGQGGQVPSPEFGVGDANANCQIATYGPVSASCLSLRCTPALQQSVSAPANSTYV